MNLETHEMRMIQTMEVPDCPVFGQAFDPNEGECQDCLDRDECEMKMNELTKPKKKEKKKKGKETKPPKEAKPIEIITKVELKEVSAATLYSQLEYVEVEQTKSKKKVKETKPIKILGKDELREISNLTLYSEYEFEESLVKDEVINEEKIILTKEKGMRKPPFFGRGGKGNTTSYIEWLLASGKWTMDEMVVKANYYLEKYGKRPVKMEMDKYIKAHMVWLVKNKGVTETVVDGKIKLTI